FVMRRIVLTLLLTGYFAGVSGQPQIVRSERMPALKLTHSFPQAVGGCEFFMINGLLVVEAFRNGQPGNYVLDTGTSAIILNEKPAAGLASESGAAVQGAVDLQERPLNSFSWCGIRSEHKTAYVADLQGFEDRLGMPVAGLIGTGLYKDYELFFDFSRQLVVIFPLDAGALHRYHQPVASLKLDLHMGIPVIEIPDASGHLLRLGLDSGSAKNLIDQACWERLGLEEDSSAGVFRLHDLSNSSSLATVSQPLELVLSAKMRAAVPFLKVDLRYAQQSGFAVDGILGMDFLSDKQVSLNLREGYLHIWGKSIPVEQSPEAISQLD
ncbi:MAG: hypothetical protein KDC44_06865, partial [Phaeodactylibacter sp.]|nr:hypothetical protein [Phaeodactylibacter sp.]